MLSSVACHSPGAKAAAWSQQDPAPEPLALAAAALRAEMALHPQRAKYAALHAADVATAWAADLRADGVSRGAANGAGR